MSRIMRYLLDKAYRQRIAASGTLELTARCNLSCAMCYIHKKEHDPIALQKELPTAFWLDMVRELQKAGTLTLLITGGEPLLRKDFREIYLACKQAGIVPSFNTNGSLFTDELIKFLVAFPPAKINVSLYGASEESYRTLCGRGEVFTQVLENLRKLKGAGLPVKINYTVTEHNISDAAAVFAIGKEMGFPVQSATYMFPPLRACENGCAQAARISPREAARHRLICEKLRLSPEQFAQWQQSVKEGSAFFTEAEEDDLRSPTERICCRAGTSSFWITYDGRLLPCGMMEQPVVSLKELPFSSAWEKIKEETDKIFLPPQCTACSLRHHCDVCAAACYAETGRFDAVPDYPCQMTRELAKLLSSTDDFGG